MGSYVFVEVYQHIFPLLNVIHIVKEENKFHCKTVKVQNNQITRNETKVGSNCGCANCH